MGISTTLPMGACLFSSVPPLFLMGALTRLSRLVRVLFVVQVEDRPCAVDLFEAFPGIFPADCLHRDPLPRPHGIAGPDDGSEVPELFELRWMLETPRSRLA